MLGGYATISHPEVLLAHPLTRYITFHGGTVGMESIVCVAMNGAASVRAQFPLKMKRNPLAQVNMIPRVLSN